MNFIQSHFWYSKSQRNGILVLIILIMILLGIWPYTEGPSSKNKTYEEAFLNLEKKMDSLKKLKDLKPEVYPFNPNYLTDFKGYQLGMSPEEIDRLLAFRTSGEYINSVEEFQNITQVHDSLLQRIAPLFRFPQKYRMNTSFPGKVKRAQTDQSEVSTTDLNLATVNDLISIEGISLKLAKRIVSYRELLMGYTVPDQLNEVYYLSNEKAQAILDKFKIVSVPQIQKLNLNTASFKELLKIPYLNYDLTRRICNYRDEIIRFSSIAELKKIDSFPIEKYDRIALYLTAQ